MHLRKLTASGVTGPCGHGWARLRQLVTARPQLPPASSSVAEVVTDVAAVATKEADSSEQPVRVLIGV